jgi:hypothetical protein
MNSLKTIVVLPRLLQRTQGRVSRIDKSPAYHIDARADGVERGAFMHGTLLLKGVGAFRPFRTTAWVEEYVRRFWSCKVQPGEWEDGG